MVRDISMQLWGSNACGTYSGIGFLRIRRVRLPPPSSLTLQGGLHCYPKIDRPYKDHRASSNRQRKLIAVKNVQSTLLACLIAFASASAARADALMCSQAAQEYNSAIDSISTYLRRYTICLNGSQGRDDCSSEFRRLRSAQSELESAVSSYSSYCDR